MHRRRSLPVSAAMVAGVLLAAGCGDGADPPSGTVSEASESSTSSTSTSTTTSTTPSTSTTSSSTTTTTSTSTSTTTEPPVVIQSDVEATYAPAPTPPGSLVVHDRYTVSIVDLATDPPTPRVVLGPIDGLLIEAARMASDGSLVVELYEDVAIAEPITVRRIVQFSPNGSIIDLIEDAALFDVAVFGGVEQALVGELWDGAVDDEGQLVAVPLDGRPPVAFGTAHAPEYGVGSIDVHDEVAVVSAFADLTELVTFTDARGAEITPPEPDR